MIDMIKLGFGKQLAAIARPLSLRDASACAVIHAEAFQQAWSSIEFENLISESKVYGDGRFDPGKGNMYGFVISRLICAEAEILSIAVSRFARGKKIGHDLLADHISALRMAGTRKLFLEVAEDNIVALKLYQSFNFRQVGMRPEYYNRLNAKSVNAQIMAFEF